MILKVPIYFDVVVEGSHDPSKLKAYLDQFFVPRVVKAIKELDFPISSNDLSSHGLSKIRDVLNVKKVRVSLLQHNQIKRVQSNPPGIPNEKEID